MIKRLYRKAFVFMIILLFVGVSFTPAIGESFHKIKKSNNIDIVENKDFSPLIFYAFDKSGIRRKEVTLPKDVVEDISNMFYKLAHMFKYEPLSEETRVLQSEFIEILNEYGLIPEELTKEDIHSFLNPPWVRFLQKFFKITSQTPFLRSPILNKINDHVNSEKHTKSSRLLSPIDYETKIVLLCNLASFGLGIPFPLLMLPRPRGLAGWIATGANTYVGSLIQPSSFIATKNQQAIALGFMGIGLSVYFGWFAYALLGYASLLFINAEEINDFGPPNNKPVISDENPPDKAKNVPVTLDKLSFRLSDEDSDRMSFTISTDPDIGGYTENNVRDGVFYLHINNLEPNKDYSWEIVVTDGEDTVNKQFSFTTEMTPFDPFDAGWQYRKEIVINHNKVTSNLSNFPVFVNFIDSDLKLKAQDDGDDIIFMDSPGVANLLMYEIEKFNSSTGELHAWIKIPLVKDDIDTKFYMYYGKSDAEPIDLIGEVWIDNFCSVWHLQDTKDSSYNTCNGEASGSGVIWEKGKLVDAVRIINKGLIGSIHPCFDDAITEELTFSCWIKWNGKDPSWPAPSYVFDGRDSYYAGGFILIVREDGVVQFTQMIGNTYDRMQSVYSLPTGQWTYISVVLDENSDDFIIYINGIQDNSSVFTDEYHDTDLYAAIGNNRWGPIDGQYRPLNGIVDEIRLAKKAFDSDWISTEYNNQNDPDSFIDLGMEETSP